MQNKVDNCIQIVGPYSRAIKCEDGMSGLQDGVVGDHVGLCEKTCERLNEIWPFGWEVIFRDESYCRVYLT